MPGCGSGATAELVARTRNLSQLARDVGISRQGLDKALSGEGNLSFATVTKVAIALGLKITFQPAHPVACESVSVTERYNSGHKVARVSRTV